MNYTKKEQELLCQLLRARDDAESSVSALINIAQENNDYYFGLLPLADGGSVNIVDKIIWQHVEGATTQILPIFTSMEHKAVEFTPLHENDVDNARALTHHISDKVLNKNNGKEVLENAIRESFINRIAWVKTTWETCKYAHQEAFKDADKKQLSKMKKEHDVVESWKQEDGSYSGHFIDYKMKSDLKITNVPLTNMVFPAELRTVEDLPYIAQKTEVMKGELYEMFDKKKIDQLGNGTSYNYIQTHPILNNPDDFVSASHVNNDTNDDMVERYTLYEHYLLTSHLSGDGALQWVQCFTANDQLLEYAVVKDNPFTPIVSVQKVSSVVGWSIADLLKDTQKQRTALRRATTSNNLNIAYPRYMAMMGEYDVESLVHNTPGGVVEVKQPGAVTIFNETPLPAQAYEEIERLGIEAQKITGVSDMNQGLDPNVLKGTNAAATVIAQMNAGSKRVLGYAKAVANGWKDVLEKSYNYIRENSNHLDITYLDGKKFMMKENSFEDRKLILTPVFGQDENLERAQLLMSLAERYKVDPALQKSYNSYQMEMMILEALGVKERHLILKNPADIPVSEEEVYQQQVAREMQSLQLQDLGAGIQLKTSQAQATVVGAENDVSRVRLEQVRIVGDQQKAAEDVITDRGNLQIKAQEAGLKQLDLQQRGEVEAAKLNIEQTKVQHQASMDLAKMMAIPTEIAHEQSLGQPTKLG